jgi:hypothetical protein
MLRIKSFDERIGAIALTMSSNRLLTNFPAVPRRFAAHALKHK